ncbi:MAG: protein-L-isoaspartate(D-aspartate) O-methyltransferase [Syntrophaceae bacterium]
MPGLFSLLTCLLLFAAADDPYLSAREEMVKAQIVGQGIKDQAVIKAMRTVKRHLFVPRHLRSRAYEDGPLPIGYGQTISQPFIVAFMTEILKIKPGSKVLEIGTGSGYQAAILASITPEVYSVEIIEALGHSARKRLQTLGFTSVQVKIADGYYGWEAYAPYDAIIVTAAAEYIPPPLIKQLKAGGRMIIPVGSPFMVQTLMRVEKQGSKVYTRNILPVRFVPLRRGS